MVKRLLLIAILIPVLLMTGCELLGLTEEEIVYETPSAALITSFNEVGSILGSEMMTAAGSADVDGIVDYSAIGIIVTGSVSGTIGTTTTSMSMILLSTYTDFASTGGVVNGTYSVNVDSVTDNDTYVEISGSLSMTADVTLTGADFASLKMDVSWTVADDVYTYSGDVIIDGVYYHAADMMAN